MTIWAFSPLIFYSVRVEACPAPFDTLMRQDKIE
jgi:hypothetical protein